MVCFSDCLKAAEPELQISLPGMPSEYCGFAVGLSCWFEFVFCRMSLPAPSSNATHPCPCVFSYPVATRTARNPSMLDLIYHKFLNVLTVLNCKSSSRYRLPTFLRKLVQIETRNRGNTNPPLATPGATIPVKHNDSCSSIDSHAHALQCHCACDLLFPPIYTSCTWLHS